MKDSTFFVAEYIFRYVDPPVSLESITKQFEQDLAEVLPLLKEDSTADDLRHQCHTFLRNEQSDKTLIPSPNPGRHGVLQGPPPEKSSLPAISANSSKADNQSSSPRLLMGSVSSSLFTPPTQGSIREVEAPTAPNLSMPPSNSTTLSSVTAISNIGRNGQGQGPTLVQNPNGRTDPSRSRDRSLTHSEQDGSTSTRTQDETVTSSDADNPATASQGLFSPRQMRPRLRPNASAVITSTNNTKIVSPSKRKADEQPDSTAKKPKTQTTKEKSTSQECHWRPATLLNDIKQLSVHLTDDLEPLNIRLPRSFVLAVTAKSMPDILVVKDDLLEPWTVLNRLYAKVDLDIAKMSKRLYQGWMGFLISKHITLELAANRAAKRTIMKDLFATLHENDHRLSKDTIKGRVFECLGMYDVQQMLGWEGVLFVTFINTSIWGHNPKVWKKFMEDIQSQKEELDNLVKRHFPQWDSWIGHYLVSEHDDASSSLRMLGKGNRLNDINIDDDRLKECLLTLDDKDVSTLEYRCHYSQNVIDCLVNSLSLHYHSSKVQYFPRLVLDKLAAMSNKYSAFIDVDDVCEIVLPGFSREAEFLAFSVPAYDKNHLFPTEPFNPRCRSIVIIYSRQEKIPYIYDPAQPTSSIDFYSEQTQNLMVNGIAMFTELCGDDPVDVNKFERIPGCILVDDTDAGPLCVELLSTLFFEEAIPKPTSDVVPQHQITKMRDALKGLVIKGLGKGVVE